MNMKHTQHIPSPAQIHSRKEPLPWHQPKEVEDEPE